MFGFSSKNKAVPEFLSRRAGSVVPFIFDGKYLAHHEVQCPKFVYLEESGRVTAEDVSKLTNGNVTELPEPVYDNCRCIDLMRAKPSEIVNSGICDLVSTYSRVENLYTLLHCDRDIHVRYRGDYYVAYSFNEGLTPLLGNMFSECDDISYWSIDPESLGIVLDSAVSGDINAIHAAGNGVGQLLERLQALEQYVPNGNHAACGIWLHRDVYPGFSLALAIYPDWVQRGLLGPVLSIRDVDGTQRTVHVPYPIGCTADNLQTVGDYVKSMLELHERAASVYRVELFDESMLSQLHAVLSHE